MVIAHAANGTAKNGALTDLSLLVSASDPDSAMILANESLQVSVKLGSDSCFAHSYMAIGWCYYALGKRDSAIYFLSKAQPLFHKIKEAENEGKCLLNLSYVYQEDDNYVKLLDCLKAARPLLETSKDRTVLANVDLTMGSTYGDMGLYAQGRQYLLSAIAIFQILKRFDFLPSAYSAYGYFLVEENNFDSALYYYHLSYAIGNRLNNTEDKAYATDNLAEAFYKKSNQTDCPVCIDSAYYYYKIALYWFTALNSPGNIKYAQMNIGEILRIKKQYKTSEKYLSEAFHFFDSAKDVKYTFNTAEDLSKLYKDMGDYKKAYEYTIISRKYKDSVDTKNRTDSISKMFALYETEKKDRTIQLLHTRQKLDEQEISKQHIIELFSAISLCLGIILSIVLFKRNRIKHQLKEVKIRNQLAGDLHDEVGSSLSSILLLSKMALGKIKGKRDMLGRIADTTKEVIDKIGDIVWMMNPKYDDGENLREKLEQHVIRIREVAQFKIHFGFDVAIDTVKLPMEIRKNVFLIVKEAINNTLKYGEAKEVNVSINLFEKSIRIAVSDDGEGFDQSTVTPGNGLATMALRTKDCGGHFTIQSSAGKGTHIHILIPLPHFR